MTADTTSELLERLDGQIRGLAHARLEDQVRAGLAAQPIVLDALPEIVAVVKAAEDVNRTFAMPKRRDVCPPLWDANEALAALTRKLNEAK